MKCLLISRFNVVNIGDLAIANKLYEITSNYFDIDRINYFGSPYQFNDIHNVENNNYSKKESFKKIINKFRINKLVKKSNKSFDTYKKIIDNYEVIIIGGGNMIMELSLNYSSIDRFYDYAEIAKKKKKKLFAMDIGIGPFQNKRQKEYAVSALNKCDKITFRDDASLELFLDNGGKKEIADVSIDPVFLYELDTKKNKNSDINNIGINLINSKLVSNDDKLFEKTAHSYIKLINNLLIDNSNVIHIFTTSKEDSSILNVLYNKFNNNNRVIINNINGFSELIKLYSVIDILIGTRMHSMIIAYSMKIPQIGLSWQTKVDEYFELIDDKESLFNFYNFDKNINSINLSVRNKLDNKNYEINKIDQRLNFIRDKYKVTLAILKTLSNS